ncbi:MAG: response regulator transcription factor [Chitinophagaceae bacterium]|nr:MAG: response regulator transcription factor [Chitinophagaceae bacterium]
MRSSKIKVLIVDDSTIVTTRLFAILSEIACVGPVLISNTFNQAVDLINVELPDAVLVDIQLPGKNGIELLAFIKSTYPQIKTVVVTNRASAYYKELCQEMGADGFVDKSTEFEKIPAIIEMLCCVDNSETTTSFTQFAKP